MVSAGNRNLFFLKPGELGELTREREGSRNAGNGGGVQFRGNAKVTFRLKRLI